MVKFGSEGHIFKGQRALATVTWYFPWKGVLASVQQLHHLMISAGQRCMVTTQTAGSRAFKLGKRVVCDSTRLFWPFILPDWSQGASILRCQMIEYLHSKPVSGPTPWVGTDAGLVGLVVTLLGNTPLLLI